MPDPNDRLLVQYGKPLVLEQMRVADHIRLGTFTRESIEVTVEMVEGVSRELVAKVEAFVLRERLANESKRVTFEAPSTWWEHLKETLYLRRRSDVPIWSFERWCWHRMLCWAYQAHPVLFTQEHRRVYLHDYAIYPFANLARPAELGTPIHVSWLQEEPSGGPWSPRG